MKAAQPALSNLMLSLEMTFCVLCFLFVDKGSIKVPLPNYVMGSFKTLNWFGAVH